VDEEWLVAALAAASASETVRGDMPAAALDGTVAAADGPTGTPHRVQNFVPAIGAPHFVQKRCPPPESTEARSLYRAPQFLQNVSPSTTGTPH
jgi:hypothetical protein